VSEGEGDGLPTRSDDRGGPTYAKEEITPSIKSTSADQGTPSEGTWSDNKENAKEEGMETDPPPYSIKNEEKIRHTDFKHTHI
jgi:hypothetical protein